MKIELEIDDKYKNTNLYLMWGMVPIARRQFTKQYWEVKTGECSVCGNCCKNLEGKRHIFKIDNGRCEHLKDDNICDLRGILFGCSVAEPRKIESCTLKWEKV